MVVVEQRFEREKLGCYQWRGKISLVGCRIFSLSPSVSVRAQEEAGLRLFEGWKDLK